MFVHESKSLEDLVGNISNSCLWEQLRAVLDHFIEILLHVLKDEVQLVVLSHNLFQPNYVSVL